MCGIVGAVSSRNIVPILVQGLQRLEYRGYDSCGVAVHAASLNGGTGGLQRARSTSRVAELMDIDSQPIDLAVGLSHRKAGEVTAHHLADLGYRRFEWKCNNENLPSKQAALRFGMTEASECRTASFG